MPNPVFSGRVSSVTYDDGAGFLIVKIQLDNGTYVTAKGHFPGQSLAPGTWVCFEGSWINHPQYGQQLSVVKSPVTPEIWSNERICSILSVQGIGPAIRNALIDVSSDISHSIIDILEGRVARTEFQMEDAAFEQAANRWKAAKAHLYAAAFLADAGVPSTAIEKVWKTFGTDLEKIVTENPWRLVEIDGIGFKEADEVARRLGVSLSSECRLQGAVLSAVGASPMEGHVYTTLAGIIGRVQGEIPGSTNANVAEAVRALVTTQTLLLDRDTQPGTVAIYEPSMHEIELSCVQKLVDRFNSTAARDMKPLFALVGENARQAFESGASLSDVAEAAIKDWSLGCKTDLTADQTKAALRALVEPVSLLTGLPGTGKTTTLRAAVSVLKDAGVHFLLIAPTGIAAKRLSSVVNAPASTIHRAFGAKGWSKDEEREATYEGIQGESSRKSVVDLESAWNYGPLNPHPAEVAVVDETSMVDLHLLHRILNGTRKDCRLVFVGDPYQLPSVGAGDVLSDLVETKLFPHSHLTQIFRQEETNGIILAAHAVHRGANPKSDGRDFVILDSATEEDAAELVLNLAKGLYTRRTNFQVLSPRHSGAAGVTSLNEKIRAELNPPSSGMVEARMGGSVVREGDRIMVIRNDYERGVYNGDVGTVRRIDRVAKDVEVSIFGPPGMPSALVRFPFKDALKSLRLAYTQTIHKCVSPDTMVWVNGGIHRIEDIPVRGWISTPEGPQFYRNKVVNPEAPAVRITTYHGYILTGTLDHGVDVWDSTQGKYARTELKDISRGDYVRLVPCPTASVVNPPRTPFTKTRKKTPKRYPRYMTPAFAEYLGIIAAFGNISFKGPQILPWRRIHWSTGILDPAHIVERFTQLTEQLFGLSTILEHKPDFAASTNNRFPSRVWVPSERLVRWFKSTPELQGLLYKDRYVPPAILTSNTKCKISFLKSFFLSAGKTFNDPVTKKHMHATRLEERGGDNPILSRIWVRSYNSRLDSELRALLLDFGVIVSRTCGTSADSWKGFVKETKIILRDEDISRFQLRIGFPTEELRNIANYPKKPLVREHRVPITPSELQAIKKVNPRYRGRSEKTISLKVAREIAGRVSSNPVSAVLADRIRFFNDWVYKVESLTSPSVCVEVPEGHRFIQNGFSAWNSQGQEYDVIVLPLLASFGKQLQRNLLYTAITRARKRVFIVGQTLAVAKAVENNSAEDRNTLLAARLTKLMKGD